MLRIIAAALFALLSSQVLAQAPGNIPTKNTSVIIATGNTFQTILAAPGSDRRNSLTIQNNNAADNCWLVVGGVLGSATKAIGILMLPGGSYTRYYPYVPSDAIHATCAVSADTLYIDTQ